jgi:hypothetical protein
MVEPGFLIGMKELTPVKNHLDRPHVVGIASETLYTASHENDPEPTFFIPVGAPNPAHGRLL